MGMYDTFRSSYDLGPRFTNVECQTKDLNSFMDYYWMDPSGQLWITDYTGTSELQEDPNWVDDGTLKSALFKYKVKSTGKHGKVKPVELTDYVTVYNYRGNESYDDAPLCRLHFVRGKLQDYQIATRKEIGVWI